MLIFRIQNGNDTKSFTIPFKYADIDRYVITSVNKIGLDNNNINEDLNKRSRVIYGKYSGMEILIALIILSTVI